MEEDPAKHLYAVGQRAPEDHRPNDPEPGDGSLRWVTVDRLDRGVVAEANAQAQQAAHVPQPEAGKCGGGSEILRG